MRSKLVALAAMTLMAASAAHGTPVRQSEAAQPRRRRPGWATNMEKTELQREIAAHNEAVERRKAEKKARKKDGA